MLKALYGFGAALGNALTDILSDMITRATGADAEAAIRARAASATILSLGSGAVGIAGVVGLGVLGLVGLTFALSPVFSMGMGPIVMLGMSAVTNVGFLALAKGMFSATYPQSGLKAALKKAFAPPPPYVPAAQVVKPSAPAAQASALDTVEAARSFKGATTGASCSVTQAAPAATSPAPKSNGL